MSNRNLTEQFFQWQGGIHWKWMAVIFPALIFFLVSALYWPKFNSTSAELSHKEKQLSAHLSNLSRLDSNFQNFKTQLEAHQENAKKLDHWVLKDLSILKATDSLRGIMEGFDLKIQNIKNEIEDKSNQRLYNYTFNGSASYTKLKSFLQYLYTYHPWFGVESFYLGVATEGQIGFRLRITSLVQGAQGE